jgi:hypothetical protein
VQFDGVVGHVDSVEMLRHVVLPAAYILIADILDFELYRALTILQDLVKQPSS